MPKKRRARTSTHNRRASSRATRRIKLHQLASMCTVQAIEPKVDARLAKLPTHIGGTYANIDPNNPDGLTPLQREALREAHAKQHLRAGGEIDATTMQMQEHWGWVVRRWHPDEPDERTLINSQLVEIDKRAQSGKRNFERKQSREAHTVDQHLKIKALKTLRLERSEAVLRAVGEENYGTC